MYVGILLHAVSYLSGFPRVQCANDLLQELSPDAPLPAPAAARALSSIDEDSPTLLTLPHHRPCTSPPSTASPPPPATDDNVTDESLAGIDEQSDQFGVRNRTMTSGARWGCASSLGYAAAMLGAGDLKEAKRTIREVMVLLDSYDDGEEEEEEKV